MLQIDAPDLASARNNQHRDLTDDQFRRIAERNIAAINAATEGLPADRMRLHICGATTKARTPTICPS